MGMVGFVVWFIMGLVGTFTLNVIFDSNPFIPAFLVGLTLGIMGARD